MTPATVTVATVTVRVFDAMRSFGRHRRVKGPRRFWRKRLPPIEQLLIVPQDLRSADPGFTFEVAEGAFGLSGISARLVDGSPFTVPAPHRAWEMDLHGFGWLRNYSTGRTPAMAEQARGFVLEWIAINGGKNRVASRPEVRARRVLSWLAHAEVILDGADRHDYDAIMSSLAEHILDLQRHARTLPAGWPRLITSIALLQAFLALPNIDAERRLAELRLTAEIDNQILSDGGHISRDPGVLIDILLDLVPLRQCFVARRLPCPEAITSAIRRIIPMLRHLRMGDGSIARFNGMGVTMPDALATALAFDANTAAALPALAPDSRYVRLEAASTIVVMDTGATPPSAHARSAHAGCLSFELSAGRAPIFVNAGNPNPSEHTSRFAPPRATSSHSGLVIAETSSAMLIDAPRTRDGAARLHGPVSAVYSADADTVAVDATHAGYSPRFGLMHRRQLLLSRDGTTVSGVDQLIPTAKRHPESAPCAIHFHLHPSVSMRMGWSANSVLLTLDDGEQWRFSADNATLSIEDSAHHALGAGSRRSQQLVLRRMTAADKTEVRWSLSRLTGINPPPAHEAGDTNTPHRSLAKALAAVTLAE
jgi:uncharacterized heparinase superfamily protein